MHNAEGPVGAIDGSRILLEIRGDLMPAMGQPPLKIDAAVDPLRVEGRF